jgi:hypothetical protein
MASINSKVKEILENPQLILEKPMSSFILDALSKGRMGAAGIICNNDDTWEVLVALAQIAQDNHVKKAT